MGQVGRNSTALTSWPWKMVGGRPDYCRTTQTKPTERSVLRGKPCRNERYCDWTRWTAPPWLQPQGRRLTRQIRLITCERWGSTGRARSPTYTRPLQPLRSMKSTGNSTECQGNGKARVALPFGCQQHAPNGAILPPRRSTGTNRKSTTTGPNSGPEKGRNSARGWPQRGRSRGPEKQSRDGRSPPSDRSQLSQRQHLPPNPGGERCSTRRGPQSAPNRAPKPGEEPGKQWARGPAPRSETSTRGGTRPPPHPGQGKDPSITLPRRRQSCFAQRHHRSRGESKSRAQTPGRSPPWPRPILTE